MAQTNISGLGDGLIKWSNPSLEGLVSDKGAQAINFFMAFSAFVAVTILVVSGYMFITSAGDPEKVEKAQKGITASIVGLVIVLLARLIMGFVLGSILKVK
jgi:chromate transport protein ChrA